MDEFMGILKALSDETRIKIVNILLSHDYCVGALTKRLDISEAAVSQHLQVLRKAGVVTGEKRGYYTHYRVNRDLLREASDKMKEMSGKTRECEGGCSKHTTGEHRYCEMKKDDNA